MKGSFSQRSIIVSILKIAIMALLLGLVWKELSSLFVGRASGKFFERVWSMLSVTLTVIGMSLGASLSLMMLTNAKIYNWLKAIISLVCVIAGAFLVRNVLLWVYEMLFAALGALLGIAVIVVLMLVVIAGTGGILSAACVLLTPAGTMFEDRHGNQYTRSEAFIHELNRKG